MQTPACPPPPVGALRDDGSVDSAQAGPVADELAVALYEHMVLARELDDRLVALQREGRIASHSSAVGEEAAIVGAAAASPRRGLGLSGLAGNRRGALAWDAARRVCAPPAGNGPERRKGAQCALPPFLEAHARGKRQPPLGHADSPRGGGGLGGACPQGRCGRPRVLRRGRHQQRGLPHGPELRRRDSSSCSSRCAATTAGRPARLHRGRRRAPGSP